MGAISHPPEAIVNVIKLFNDSVYLVARPQQNRACQGGRQTRILWLYMERIHSF